MVWKKSGKAQKLLEAQFESGNFGASTKPKEAWESDCIFKEYAIENFRTHFNSEKKKRGLHLVMVKYAKDSKEEPSEEEVEEKGSPFKRAKVESVIPSELTTLPLLTTSWYQQEMENYNSYVVSPWSHPTTSINYVDFWILLPSGVTENEQYRVNVSECGTKVLIYLFWPNEASILLTRAL